MSLSLWLAFAGTVAVLVLTPGPSVLLASSHGIRYGPARALGTICGDLSANVVQMSVASLGLAALVQASAGWFEALKWLGVAWLAWMGLRRILAPGAAAAPEPGGGPSFWSLYLRGFTVSAANPKAVVFFATFFPLFLVPAEPLAPQLVVLGLTFVTLDGLALNLYVRTGHRLRAWLVRRGLERWEDRVAGSLLLGAGLALAFKRTD